MSDFNTALHPRTTDGKFAEKAHEEPDEGLLALSDCLKGTNALNARLVLRGYGAGCGLMYRLNDDEATTVAHAINEATAGHPRETHSAIARKVVHDFLEWRAASDNEPMTEEKAARILDDAAAANKAATSGYDRAYRRLADARATKASQVDIAEMEAEIDHSARDRCAAARRHEQALWDWVYLGNPDQFAVSLDDGEAGALEAAERFEDPGYTGAIGACCEDSHDDAP